MILTMDTMDPGTQDMQDSTRADGCLPVCRGVASALLLLFVLGSILPATAQDRVEGRALPFSIGETLVFTLDWRPPWYLFFLPPMDAGDVEVSISDNAEYNGRKALKIKFSARSSGTFTRLVGIKVEDNYEFLTDPDTFCTFRAFKQEREGKRKRDIEVTYFAEEHRLHIRELDMAVTPPKVKRDEDHKEIPACVQDLFSALYSARRKEFFPGADYKSMVGDNDKVKEIEIRVGKSETVQTPAGSFKAWKVDTISLVGGLFRHGGQLRIWVTADMKKVPVQLEVKVNLGTVVGKLKSARF